MARRNLRSLVMAAAILSLALGGEALGQDEWQTVTSPDGSFTVEMPPGKVFYFQDELKTAKGTPYTSHQYLVDLSDGQRTFIAQAATFPDDSGILEPKPFMEGFLKAQSTKLNGGKWSSVEWGAQQGAVTVEAFGVEGETDKRCFKAVKGKDAYDLFYWGPHGTATSPDASRFFSSLKIGEGAAPSALPPIESTPLQGARP
jgi:hypothetical protein